jgi:hypothetical protein
MAFVNYSVMIPDVQIGVPTCPGPTILRALQRAAREFFQMSESYQFVVHSLEVDSPQITIELPEQTEIYRPLDMTFRGRPVWPITQEQATLRYGDWADPLNAHSSPAHIMRTSPNTLALVPVAHGDTGVLRGTIALRPTRLAEGVEEDQIEACGDFIVYGASANLMSIPGTPWYKPDTVGYYQSRFERGARDVRSLARGTHVESTGVVAYGGI